ncbi:hypothetical protein HWV62_7740 [Athelia sp. TMB]|nr:hypothetical protein HWV62_7740 [Athelia sp. TMB]
MALSSQILTKIDAAPASALDAKLAGTWLAELDETILDTKTRIHDRIHADFPAFERQRSAAVGVKERLSTLTTTVDALAQALEHPERASDARHTHAALAHLQRTHAALGALADHAASGRLCEAVKASREVEKLLGDMQEVEAKVWGEVRQRWRTLRDSVEEQLGEAYTRSVVVSPSEIIIRPSVTVRGSDNIITLPALLRAISPPALAAHLSTLRRDLTTHHITHLLAQPCSLTITLPSPAGQEFVFAHVPAPPNSEKPSSRLSNVAALLSFLGAHLYSSLPPLTSQASPTLNCTHGQSSKTFAQALAAPVSHALLHTFLLPRLPSSLDALPPFLALVRGAVDLETMHSGGDGEVQIWARGVSGHYARARRNAILQSARQVVSAPDNGVFLAEVEATQDRDAQTPGVVPIQDVEEDAWGLEDEAAAEKKEQGEDAWGWTDDAEEPAVEVEDDDPWADPIEDVEDDDPWADPPLPPVSNLRPSLVPATKRPTPISTNRAASKPKRTALQETYPVSTRARAFIALARAVLDESTALIGSRVFSSGSTALTLTTPHSNGVGNGTDADPTVTAGTIIATTASQVLDVYRALFPVAHAVSLGGDAKGAGMVQWANDCAWVSGEVRRILADGAAQDGVEGKLVEAQDGWRVLATSWYDDAIDNQRQAVDALLLGADGFVDTAEQKAFDRCERAVAAAVGAVRAVAGAWKSILPHSRYLPAIGAVADAAIARVLADVLALPDIPAVESQKLGELSRILNSLEGLFVEGASGQSMVVAFVPSWLKYSYLAELLEASLADITYLFDEGALVDFEVDELVKLVRALFADTPARGKAIGKLMGGHPAPRRDA